MSDTATLSKRGWTECKIGDLLEKITSGGTPSTKVKEYYGGTIPWLNTKEINFNRIYSTEQTITEEGLRNSSAKWIKVDSVIVAMYGATAGKVAINKIPLTTNQACCNISLNSSKADYRFIYYHLYNSYNELQMMATGAAQQNLNVGMLSSFLVRIPSIPEQRAIAAVLSSLDDKIDLLHRQNKTLESLAETIWRKMFIEDADPKWSEGILGDLMTVSTGKGLKRDEYIENGIYPVIGANGEIGRTNNYLTEERLILTGRVGTLGELFINYNQKIWISDNVLIVKPNDDKYFYFIYFLLKEVEFENLNVGSTQPLVTQTDLKRIDCLIPNDSLVEDFQDQCVRLFDKIHGNTNQIRTLSHLRDTLLPKLMNGELQMEGE